MAGSAESLRSLGIPRHDDEAARPAAPAAANQTSIPGGLDELYRDAIALQRRFEGAGSAGAQAWDGSRMVRATVDGSGRVTDIALADPWRRTVGTGGLAGAVLDVIGRATVERLSAWGEAVAETPDPVSAPDPPPVPRGDRPDMAPDSADERRTIGEILSALDGLEPTSTKLERRIDEPDNRTVVGRSPNHATTLTLTADGAATGITTRQDIAKRALSS